MFAGEGAARLIRVDDGIGRRQLLAGQVVPFASLQESKSGGAPVTEAKPATTTSASRGYMLQCGAFRGADQAESMRLRLGQQGNSAQVQQARDQARAGQAEQAVGSYQAALGNQAPTGPLALEYYQTLGGTNEGWDEARVGLERLAQAQEQTKTKHREREKVKAKDREVAR